jgi:transcriptional regulator with XRE-family HTH domain
VPSSKLAKWLPGREVRVRRLERKLSQAAVGRFVKRTDQTVAKWERGEKCPDVGQMWALAAHLGMDEELKSYMIQIAENEHEENFQADRRFNALCLSMAERSNGLILKWETYFIPGIAQTRAYHFDFVKVGSNGTDEQANRGWAFKKERQEALLKRTDSPQVKMLIAATAIEACGTSVKRPVKNRSTVLRSSTRSRTGRSVSLTPSTPRGHMLSTSTFRVVRSSVARPSSTQRYGMPVGASRRGTGSRVTMNSGSFCGANRYR